MLSASLGNKRWMTLGERKITFLTMTHFFLSWSNHRGWWKPVLVSTRARERERGGGLMIPTVSFCILSQRNSNDMNYTRPKYEKNATVANYLHFLRDEPECVWPRVPLGFHFLSCWEVFNLGEWLVAFKYLLCNPLYLSPGSNPQLAMLYKCQDCERNIYI